MWLHCIGLCCRFGLQHPTSSVTNPPTLLLVGSCCHHNRFGWIFIDQRLAFGCATSAPLLIKGLGGWEKNFPLCGPFFTWAKMARPQRGASPTLPPYQFKSVFLFWDCFALSKTSDFKCHKPTHPPFGWKLLPSQQVWLDLHWPTFGIWVRHFCTSLTLSRPSIAERHLVHLCFDFSSSNRNSKPLGFVANFHPHAVDHSDIGTFQFARATTWAGLKGVLVVAFTSNSLAGSASWRLIPPSSLSSWFFVTTSSHCGFCSTSRTSKVSTSFFCGGRSSLLFAGTSLKASSAYLNTATDFHLPKNASSWICMPALTYLIAPLLRGEWPLIPAISSLFHAATITSFVVFTFPFVRKAGSEASLPFAAFTTMFATVQAHSTPPLQGWQMHFSVLFVPIAAWSVFDFRMAKVTCLLSWSRRISPIWHSRSSISRSIQWVAHT